MTDDTGTDRAVREGVDELLSRLGALIAAEVPVEGPIERLVHTAPLDATRFRGLTVQFETVGQTMTPNGPWFWVSCSILTGGGESRVGNGFARPTREEFLREVVDGGAEDEQIAALLIKGATRLWRRAADPPDRAAMLAAGTHAIMPAGPDCEHMVPEMGRFGTDLVEHLYISEEIRHDRQELSLVRCASCGQVFVRRYLDGWNFFARLSEEEAALVRVDYYWADLLIQSRRHLTRPPAGYRSPPYWAPGPEPELIRRAADLKAAGY